MSVLHFLLLTLFFLNLYTSILITLTCRYVIASDSNDFLHKSAQLSLEGPYMSTSFNPNGNMICRRGKLKRFQSTYSYLFKGNGQTKTKNVFITTTLRSGDLDEIDRHVGSVGKERFTSSGHAPVDAA